MPQSELGAQSVPSGMTGYYVRSGGDHAFVFDDAERKVGSLTSNADGSFELIADDGTRYHFTRKVDGEMRPFSISVTSEDKQVLKIRDRLFSHDGVLYIISNVPENRSKESYLGGPKFISRIDGIDPNEVDVHVSSRAERRLRGTHVGQISGIGSIGMGHSVSVEPELQDIGMVLATASFILNTTLAGDRQVISVKEK